jgi:uncharacterized membrane protein
VGQTVNDFEALVTHFRFGLGGNWYLLSISSLFLYGVYQYWIDYLAERRRARLSAKLSGYVGIAASSSMITVMMSAYTLWRILVVKDHDLLVDMSAAIYLGVLQGALFLFSNVYRMEARRRFPQHVVLPFTRFSTVLVVLCAFFVFDEVHALSQARLFGIVSVAISIYLFGSWGESKSSTGESTSFRWRDLTRAPAMGHGLASLVMATLISAAMAILAKYAVGPTNLQVSAFVLFSNAFTSIGAFVLIFIERSKRKSVVDPAASVRELRRSVGGMFASGCVLGVVNLAGYLCFLSALKSGDASVVVPINSLSVVVPIVMATIFQGVVLTDRVACAVIMSLVSMTLFNLS